MNRQGFILSAFLVAGLGVGCHDELGSHFDPSVRGKLFEMADREADRGDRSANVYVAWSYATGSGVVRDIDHAAKHFQSAERRGSKLAERLLDILAADNIDDRTEACVAEIRRFTRAGDPDAQMITASWLLFGEGVAVNESEAKRLFKIAADHGSSFSRKAQNLLDGLEKDR